MARFATQPAILKVPQRTLWLAGQMSPRAKKEFTVSGWTIYEGKEQ